MISKETFGGFGEIKYLCSRVVWKVRRRTSVM